MSRKLVAYFSASGVTARAARALAEAAEADLFEIQPAVPYTPEDLNWNNKTSRSSVEMQDPASRPALANRQANIPAYDTVFVGFPIWWYVAPTIINSFLESYDFSGKVIVPFATSGGSGLGNTVEKLQPSVADSAVWKPATLLNGRPTKEALTSWVDSLEL